MGEWFVLLYFSVQMLHVVMVWLGLVLDCFYMILTVFLVCGGLWVVVGGCGLKVPSKN